MILAKLIERILPVEVGFDIGVTSPCDLSMGYFRSISSCELVIDSHAYRRSGSVTPASSPRKSFEASTCTNVVMAEQVDDALRLVEPQQAVIDEHAGELIADRLMDQHGRDRGVDAA